MMLELKFKLPRETMSRALLSALFLITYLAVPASGEGFPGKGDRLLYAEALPHYNLGNKYLAREWYEKAVEKYLDAIKIYEYDADVYTNLAVAYRKLNDIESAETAMRKAVELEPYDWTGWSNLANLLMVQEKFADSYQCFQYALKSPGIPAQEKAFIESNIDGIKKIMKARGLSVDGKPLASMAEPQPVAKKGGATKLSRSRTRGASSKFGASASTERASGGAASRESATLEPARVGAATADSSSAKRFGAPPASVRRSPTQAQIAGGKESEIDQNAFSEWLNH